MIDRGGRDGGNASLACQARSFDAEGEPPAASSTRTRTTHARETKDAPVHGVGRLYSTDPPRTQRAAREVRQRRKSPMSAGVFVPTFHVECVASTKRPVGLPHAW